MHRTGPVATANCFGKSPDAPVRIKNGPSSVGLKAWRNSKWLLGGLQDFDLMGAIVQMP